MKETGLKIAFYIKKKRKKEQTSTIYHLCQTVQMGNKYFAGRGVVERVALKA